MNQSDHLIRPGDIGRALVNHFSNLFSPGDSFVFCVHKELIDALCDNFDITQETFEKSILNAFKNGGSDDEYNSVAIAGYQVSIAYENLVNSNESYNQAIQEKLFYESHELQSLYKAYQDRIWKAARRCFERKDLNLLIPKPKNNSYRYVQYPLSQKIINQNVLTKCKADFTKIHLRPDCELSFSEFSNRVFNGRKCYIRNKYLEKNPANYSTEYEKIARIVIFGFYQVWKGEQQEKRKRKIGMPKGWSASKREECYIKVSNNQTFQCFDKQKNILPIQQMFEQKQIFYEYSMTYDIWINVTRISSGDIIGTMIQTDWFEYLLAQHEDFGNYILERYRQDLFSFIVLSENIPNKIKILLRLFPISKSFFHFCGGLKNAEGAYIQSILPTVVLDESHTELFIDSTCYTVANNCFNLNTITLEPGSHSIKAKETDIICFTIASNAVAGQDVDLGWKYEWQKAPIISTSISECVLNGLAFYEKSLSGKIISRNHEGSIQPCILRNQELRNRPFSNSMCSYLKKWRSFNEF